MTEEVPRTRRPETEMHEREFARRRRNQHREPSPLRHFVREHRFEVIWSTALVLGLFLLFGPMAHMLSPEQSGNSTALFFSRILAAIDRQANLVADLVLHFVKHTNWAIKVGSLLLFSALVVLPFRVRWWLMNRSPWLTMCCPRCQSSIHRTHRRLTERALSAFVPMRRYRCLKCGWSGIRIEGQAALPAPAAGADTAPRPLNKQL